MPKRFGVIRVSPRVCHVRMEIFTLTNEILKFNFSAYLSWKNFHLSELITQPMYSVLVMPNRHLFGFEVILGLRNLSNT